MNNFELSIGEVVDVESISSPHSNDSNNKNDKPYDGLRVRAKLPNDKTRDNKLIPWAFPLLPKTFQSVPKIGEAVFVFNDGTIDGQRYYIGPIISQPQFNTKAPKNSALSLLKNNKTEPLERISNDPNTTGSFPKQTDVAVVGRGREDIILRSNNGRSELTDDVNESEIQIRAGIRSKATNDSNPNMIGNIIFNGTDPAYIQLKYKTGLIKNDNDDEKVNSVINMVANRINIMSNNDGSISHNIGDNKSLIQDNKMEEIMNKLHQVPMGDELVKLLEIMKGCIMYHTHPWPGMRQSGDWSGYINQLNTFDISSILSKYVRIS